MANLERKSLDAPDEIRPVADKGKVAIVKLGSLRSEHNSDWPNGATGLSLCWRRFCAAARALPVAAERRQKGNGRFMHGSQGV
jgi:hypothetical protein